MLTLSHAKRDKAVHQAHNLKQGETQEREEEKNTKLEVHF